jgi:ankyrin repeat protein
MKIGQTIEAIDMRKNKNKVLSSETIKAIYSDDIALLTDYLSTVNIDNIDRDNRSLIFHAILAGNVTIAKLCISKNAQINIQDKIGWYPLHYAAQNYQVEIAKLLIENSAKMEAKDNYGNTVLWRAVFASEGKGDMIKLLLLKGANPDNPNNSGISPLKLATTIANYNLLQFFNL